MKKIKATIYFIKIFALFFIIISCEIKENKPFKTISDSPNIKYRIMHDEISIYDSNFKILNSQAADFSNEGIELAQRGNLVKAKVLFKKALALEPNSPVILNNLEEVEFENKNFEQAIEYYNKSIEISDSTYLYAAQNLGITYGVIGEKDLSEKLLKFVIKDSKIDFIKGASYYSLTKMYLDYGDIENAKYALKNAEKYLETEEYYNDPIAALESKILNYYK